MLGLVGVAHATLGVDSTGDAFRKAAKLAIVDAHGRVVDAVRGARAGERIDVTAAAKAESLALCDADGLCSRSSAPRSSAT
ncbi:MAG: hypothetical protein ACM31C_24430 [Acidobacteriota bacterium]